MAATRCLISHASLILSINIFLLLLIQKSEEIFIKSSNVSSTCGVPSPESFFESWQGKHNKPNVCFSKKKYFLFSFCRSQDQF